MAFVFLQHEYYPDIERPSDKRGQNRNERRFFERRSD